MSMQIFEVETEAEHETVRFCSDPSANYRGIIAVHSTRLGPALGGARFWHYASDDEAVTDALRLARGMTYKNALAGLPFGGGKSIILGDRKTAHREEIFRAHGRFVETLGGSYITAEDVGTSPADMEYVLMETKHVAGLIGRSGDPSPLTAHGVFRAIQASAKFRWDTDELAGRTVAVQGLGHVGYHLSKKLHDAGAHLVVTDIEAERIGAAVAEFGAEAVAPEEIYHVRADIFAPCALGGIINDRTLPQLQMEIVAGAANNQLLDPAHGDRLAQRDILFAPDYVANAGGVLHGGIELLGWTREYSFAKVHGIYDTLLSVFDIARREGIPTHRAADRLAERRLLQAT